MRANPDPLLAPAYAAFPAARPALDACRAEILRLYPPVPAVARVRVCDPGTGATVRELADGAELDLADLPAGATLVADPSALPCTIAFEWDGNPVATERVAPHCVSGDVGGSLRPWDGLTPGDHVLRVTPFDVPGGEQGELVTIRLTVRPRPVPEWPEPRPEDGWTPTPLAPGAREVFVRADGDDGNAGDAPDRPVRSVAKAMSLLRPDAGDRVRLFAGHAFDGPIGRWRFSGRPGMPAGVMAYGDSPDRPVVAIRAGSGILFDVPGVHDVAFVGLRLTAAGRDPGLPGFDVRSAARYGVEAICATRNVLFEDCVVDHFLCNFNLVALPRGGGRHAGLVIRRCVVADAWAPPALPFRGHGVYAEGVVDLRIVECVFDHNGWVEGVPGVSSFKTQFRHGVYASAADMGPVAFEGNVCAANANCGTQQRSGGAVRGNVFVDNGVSALLSGADAEFADNLVVGGHDTVEHGLSIAVSVSSRAGRVLRNVMLDADGACGPFPAARVNVDRREWTAAGPREVVVAGNAVAGCDGPAFRNGDRVAALTLADNDFAGVGTGQQVIALDRKVDRLVATGNVYAGASETCFTHHARPGERLSLGDWTALTGDTSTEGPAAFLDPAWRLPPDFVARARARGRMEWDSAASAAAVVALAQAAYLRQR